MANYARFDHNLQVVELIDTGGFDVSDLFTAEYLNSLVPVPVDTDVVLGGCIERRGDEVVFYPPSQTGSESGISPGRVWREAKASADQDQQGRGLNKRSLLRSLLNRLAIGKR